jgi:V/A-type H+-transporting ATPase subunit A
LAFRRHFPAINWNGSYSLFTGALDPWYRQNVAPDYPELRDAISELLQREAGLQEIVQLVGPDALQDAERLVIEVGRIIREDFLQQNAYHEIDAYCSMGKAYGIMKMILTLYKEAEAAIRRGVNIDEILALPVIERIGRARYVSEEEFPRYFEEAMREIEGAFKALA